MYPRVQHIILLFAACFLMLSCGSTGEDIAEGSEMTFVVSDVSRASVTTGMNQEGSKFAIYGDMKSSGKSPKTVFDEVVVSYSNGKWGYDDPQYWFPNFEYSFIALHPMGVSGVSDVQYSESQLSFKYTLPGNFASTNDLMVATHRRMIEPTYENTPIALKFSHILTRVDFVVKNDMAADFVRVKGIKLEGINSSGSFSILPASIISGGRTDDYSSSWTDISDKVDLNAEILVDIPENKTGSLFPDNNALFMIPQPDNKAVMMEISYELWDDGKKFEEYTVRAQAPIGGWEQGKIYTYAITVVEISKEIYVTDVSVKDWQSQKTSEIPVPEV